MTKIIEKIKKSTYPIMILHGVVVFPKIPTAFEVEDNKYVDILKKAKRDKEYVFLAFSEENDDDKINDVGVLCEIKQIIKSSDSPVYKVIAEGICRSELTKYDAQTDPFICEAATRLLYEEDSYKNSTLVEFLRRLFDENKSYFTRLTGDFAEIVNTIDDASMLCDFLAANLLYTFSDKIRILSIYDISRRVEQLDVAFHDEKEIFSTEREITRKVHEKLSGNQRDIFLREQMKVIRSELGEDEEDEDDLWIRITQSNLPNEIREKFEKEYAKMTRMSFGSAEATVIRNYLETCLEIPWGVYTKDKINVERARKILERDHWGLEKVKERILEYLAVKQLSPDLKGQILCLVGPPGVGKTSIARSIASSMGRNYVRASLGGVRDEADIRGHRKTYIGSMPGRIVAALSQSGSMNPLFLLDEVDKLTNDSRSDPSAALLEALDSEQNHAFRDHFVEIPVDLSDCIFIATANTTDTIPRPLLDRMELISVPGYTANEKLAIAKKHLIPKQLKRHGMTKSDLLIKDAAITELIECYTKESGVRNLEREIARVCRKIAKRIITEEKKKYVLQKGDLEELIGKHKIKPEKVDKKSEVGVVNGLAWTEVGGEMLKIEALSMEGNGKIEITGSLGDVMTESAKVAVSLCRRHADEFGISNAEFYKNRDIHIHAPEGAIPKDGPSAGVTMTTALVSELSGIPVRQNVAMTGEITLHGNVLPIGGLREKTMAAYTAGVETVIVPIDNLSDLEDVDEIVRNSINIIGAKNINDVLRIALDR